MNHKLSQNVFVYILIFQFIHRNRTTHFYRNYFSRILSVPIRRTPKRNSGSPKQIREKKKRPITTVCLGLLKIRLGTLRIHKKIISIKMGCSVTVYIIEFLNAKNLCFPFHRTFFRSTMSYCCDGLRIWRIYFPSSHKDQTCQNGQTCHYG